MVIIIRRREAGDYKGYEVGPDELFQGGVCSTYVQTLQKALAKAANYLLQRRKGEKAIIMLEGISAEDLKEFATPVELQKE